MRKRLKLFLRKIKEEEIFAKPGSLNQQALDASAMNTPKSTNNTNQDEKNNDEDEQKKSEDQKEQEDQNSREEDTEEHDDIIDDLLADLDTSSLSSEDKKALERGIQILKSLSKKNH